MLPQTEKRSAKMCSLAEKTGNFLDSRKRSPAPCKPGQAAGALFFQGRRHAGRGMTTACSSSMDSSLALHRAYTVVIPVASVFFAARQAPDTGLWTKKEDSPGQNVVRDCHDIRNCARNKSFFSQKTIVSSRARVCPCGASCRSSGPGMCARRPCPGCPFSLCPVWPCAGFLLFPCGQCGRPGVHAAGRH